MHTTKSSDKITPFGGLNFCLESFHDSGLAGLINRNLGPRGEAATFSYSDIMANLMSVLFTGGDCAEDLAEHLREPLHRTRGLSVCSPDTLLRGVRQLACDSEEFTHLTSGVKHTFNINEPLNELLVAALLVPVGKHSLYDSHGRHSQFLSLHHRRVLTAPSVAESHLPAQKIDLSLHQRARQVDSLGTAKHPQTLHP